jgi:hypothetical protein
MALQLPHLNSCRRLSQFVFADARILAARGDYKSAFSRCVTGKKFARHVSDRPIITYMVAVAINAMADKCLQNILADMTDEPETLTRLKDQLAELEKTRYSLKPCFDYEAQATAGFMTKQQIEKSMNWQRLRSVLKPPTSSSLSEAEITTGNMSAPSNPVSICRIQRPTPNSRN